ncbi:MAG: GrpB family protein [Myxococcales bacterium]|nr:GrpB family protein [Myxococcales bacterium]
MFERSRSISIAATSAVIGALLPFSSMLGGLGLGLAYLYWTRRDLVSAMIRINRLVLPQLALVEWSPRWAEEVENERARLLEALAPHTSRMRSDLIHAGSTAVPGIEAAKPIHDVAFLIADDRAPTELIDTLRRLDYFIIGTPPHAPAGGDTWALWLPKDESEQRTRGSGFGLHLVGPSGRERIASMVVHARYLAEHPEEARAYSTAKRHAALRQAPDAENYRAYVEGKAAFIVDQKARAEEWHASVHGPVDLERDYPLFGGTARAKATASTPTPAAT